MVSKVCFIWLFFGFFQASVHLESMPTLHPELLRNCDKMNVFSCTSRFWHCGKTFLEQTTSSWFFLPLPGTLKCIMFINCRTACFMRGVSRLTFCFLAESPCRKYEAMPAACRKDWNQLPDSQFSLQEVAGPSQENSEHDFAPFGQSQASSFPLFPVFTLS